MIYFQRAGENGSVAFVLIEIQIDFMGIVFLGELPDGKGLAALTAAFEDERFVPFRLLPFFQDTLNFSFQHRQPSFDHDHSICKIKIFFKGLFASC